MCTAATYCNGDFYFGRNLDYEFSYGEHVTIMPRNYPIRLHSGALDRHHAMIGMAHIQDDYPLYYDAVNEKGLCIAGLNFVGNAVYPPVTRGVASAQPSAIPAFTAYSTAVWLMTGSVPGIPVQTGQQREFWLPPNSALQVQKTLDLVRSSAWISRPITGIYDDMIKLLLLTSIPEQRFQTAVQRHLQPVEWLLHRTACPQWTYRSACLLHYSRRG